ncbi:MAG: bifunctional phosphoribosylaminoimidazolecarboxamide formyltransferase/IMP cyclohydrolase [Cyclobacteriaceae bacterium]|jgi:phosphoribosylaminoimidazolecarboxamide formyltransferase / IMP cyclohydrolase|nr:bifunctional phosphoribosylaminoimidazolecarboxamide formyltransferase/IMP cyclohydrolase [Cyclobacteriaceae bacterium]
MKKIKSALISVYHKDNLKEIVKTLHANSVQLISTGGTQSFIENLDIPVTAVDSLTDYPSIFGGRVKTLHPVVFGGILNRRDNQSDSNEKTKFKIPDIDLVIVDLYPFEETVASGASEEDIIEKIDIGGISLIRGAAKNFNDVLIVSSREQYEEILDMLNSQDCSTNLVQRKQFARKAFDISSHYDSSIFNYFNAASEEPSLKISARNGKILRYGENPHQKGQFFGDLEELFDQINGKELSYNNLVDVDAAILLINEFSGENAFAIIKHTNACGVATADTTAHAYLKALEADSISAFGGVLISNSKIDINAANELNKLFFEILIAPEFDDDALAVLKSKKNRILLHEKKKNKSTKQFKSLLNGVIEQDNDNVTDQASNLSTVTKISPTNEQVAALIFASKVCKHTKSNTIVFAKSDRLVSIGTGQTSRVDSLKQAIEKAHDFGLSLKGAVMASDAFFPFPDCVELAYKAGITAVIQPGGSIKDQLSIDYCDTNEMSMVFTGIRHFKH